MKAIAFLIAATIQFLTLCPALHAQTGSRSSLEAKLALENSLEKRVRMVLAEALGTEDIIVIISADMQEQEKKAAELMPGIPQQEKMGEPSLSSSLTMVKKISASLILDRSVSEEDTKLARKLAAGLLGLPADRADLVLIEKMDFRKAKPLTAADLFVPPNLWSLVWIVVVLLLALFTVALFLAPLSKAARAFVEAFSAHTAAQAAAAAAGGGTAREEKQEEARETAAKATETAAAAQASADGRKPPFWFLNAAQLASLTFIMKGRSTEDLTILLSYAPGDMAAKLSEALYPKSAEALAALPKVTLMPESRIRAFEAELLSSLDYVVGGEDKAVNILSGLDEAVQEKALAAFAQLDPALGKKLNASIVRFSALADLEPLHAQALTRRVPMRVLAAALKSSAYTAQFLEKLSGGMQERLKQELDLTRDLPAEAYKADRAKVVEALRQLAKEGFITLKGAGAPKPAAAAAPAGAKPAALPPMPGAPAGAKPAALPPLPGAPAGAKPAALPPLPGAPAAGKPAPLPPLPGAKPPLPAAKN